MPLFSDVYKALLKKGIEFPSSSSSAHSPDKGFAQPSQEAGSPMKEKKLVSDLPPKYQKIISEMNLLKGNINFTNELLDETRTKQQLKENETVLDLLKALKEMENKLFELIQTCENEDVMAVCLLVNEDMQKTFQRFKQIKNNEKPEAFMPGEYLQISTIQYLEPSHVYGGDKASKSPEKPPVDLFDMMGGGPPVEA